MASGERFIDVVAAMLCEHLDIIVQTEPLPDRPLDVWAELHNGVPLWTNGQILALAECPYPKAQIKPYSKDGYYANLWEAYESIYATLQAGHHHNGFRVEPVDLEGYRGYLVEMKPEELCLATVRLLPREGQLGLVVLGQGDEYRVAIQGGYYGYVKRTWPEAYFVAYSPTEPVVVRLEDRAEPVALVMPVYTRKIGYQWAQAYNLDA